MQSPKLSFAGCPLARPKVANARDAASAISRPNGTIETGPASMTCSSHSEVRVARLIAHHARASTKVGVPRTDSSPATGTIVSQGVEHDLADRPAGLARQCSGQLRSLGIANVN